MMPQNEITAESSEAAVSSAVAGAQANEASQAQKSFILGLVCSSHTLNHIQSGVTSEIGRASCRERV